MKKQILITIGREYGSGGHDLAALLSQRLGIRMLDRELIDELWKNNPEMQQLAQQYDERPANRILSRKINEFLYGFAFFKVKRSGHTARKYNGVNTA